MSTVLFYDFRHLDIFDKDHTVFIQHLYGYTDDHQHHDNIYHFVRSYPIWNTNSVGPGSYLSLLPTK